MKNIVQSTVYCWREKFKILIGQKYLVAKIIHSSIDLPTYWNTKFMLSVLKFNCNTWCNLFRRIVETLSRQIRISICCIDREKSCHCKTQCFCLKALEIDWISRSVSCSYEIFDKTCCPQCSLKFINAIWYTTNWIVAFSHHLHTQWNRWKCIWGRRSMHCIMYYVRLHHAQCSLCNHGVIKYALYVHNTHADAKRMPMKFLYQWETLCCFNAASSICIPIRKCRVPKSWRNAILGTDEKLLCTIVMWCGVWWQFCVFWRHFKVWIGIRSVHAYLHFQECKLSTYLSNVNEKHSLELCSLLLIVHNQFSTWFERDGNNEPSRHTKVCVNEFYFNEVSN